MNENQFLEDSEHLVFLFLIQTKKIEIFSFTDKEPEQIEQEH